MAYLWVAIVGPFLGILSAIGIIEGHKSGKLNMVNVTAQDARDPALGLR